ncbi:MAG: sulfatase-like hydrolase/transferase [Kofleriaceae bacterium]
MSRPSSREPEVPREPQLLGEPTRSTALEALGTPTAKGTDPSTPTIDGPQGTALPSLPWIVLAHTIGGTAIGAMEAARLGGSSLAMVLIPLFAAFGTIIGAIVAGITRVVRERGPWLTAFTLAAPSLVVMVPVSRTLFQGAYAQTLPMASLLPYVLPLVVWVAVAVAIAGGRRLLRATDLTTRSIAILGCAGALGAIVWAERNVLKSGYPDAHVAATLAVIVLAGCTLRVAWRGRVSPYVAAVAAALSLGTATAASIEGLQSPRDRQVLVAIGDQGKDLVRLVRALRDADGDGSSVLLGGGDCDDGDSRRHPGAIDVPADGIDQDCDGADAAPLAAETTPGEDLAVWRATPEVQELLARTKKMNVLLVTVDALRFDVLAPGTPDRAEFPNLVKLLDDSVWFVRAIAPAAGTDISLGTMLTGRIDPFQTIEWTLPEALRNVGRKTTSALPKEVERYVGETMLRRGIDRPKTVHTDWGTSDVGDHVSASATTLEGIRALDDAKSASWFVWLHYFDVHEHHQIDVPKSLLSAVSDAGGKKRHVYRALLLAIDREIGRVRAELEKRGLADNTIIVFASDHGESLGEDPRLGDTHGKVGYAPLVRIPLAIHVPGVTPGVRTDAVTLVDLAPTLLGLLGAPDAMAPLDGIDLLPSILGAPEALRPMHRALTIHEEQQWGVVEWPHQLLVRPAEDVVELYDLEADPAQNKNLRESHPEVVARLRARFAEAPQVPVDRTIDGRKWRERRAQPPPNRVPRPAAAATSTP